jgi:hypothetical protein
MRAALPTHKQQCPIVFENLLFTAPQLFCGLFYLVELTLTNEKKGLILQGCGGDLEEWVDGINELLTNEGILLNGSTFKDVCSFEHQGTTCLLFMMGDSPQLDIGKLAIWRLSSHEAFGGTWLSDYLPNRLGVSPQEQDEEHSQTDKPQCPLIGADGNIFNLMGLASNTLKENGMRDQAKEMCERVRASGGYDDALAILMEYVEPVESQDMEIDDWENNYMDPMM